MHRHRTPWNGNLWTKHEAACINRHILTYYKRQDWRLMLLLTTAIAACGSVAAPCAETVCADKCVDLKTDRNNCGQCGFACTPTEACVAGACVAS